MKKALALVSLATASFFGIGTASAETFVGIHAGNEQFADGYSPHIKGKSVGADVGVQANFANASPFGVGIRAKLSGDYIDADSEVAMFSCSASLCTPAYVEYQSAHANGRVGVSVGAGLTWGSVSLWGDYGVQAVVLGRSYDYRPAGDKPYESTDYQPSIGHSLSAEAAYRFGDKAIGVSYSKEQLKQGWGTNTYGANKWGIYSSERVTARIVQFF